MEKKYVVNCSVSPIRLSDDKLTGFVIAFKDITEVVEYQQAIEYMSYHDDLTGLYNRRFMMEELERLDKVNLLPLTIMVIDMNNLKETNDHYGHAMGDRLIKKTTKILKRFFHKKGTISRTGGDEFVMLIPETTEEQAENLKANLLGEMKTHRLGEIPLSVAIGFATKTEPKEDVQEKLKMADDHMYEHKRIYKQTEK